MKSKPITYNIYGALFLALAISIPLQITYLYEYNLFNNFSGVMSKISDFNLIMIVGFLTVAYLFFEAKSYLKYFIPVLSLIVFINNYFVSSYGRDFNFSQTLMSSALFSITIGIFYLTKSYDLLFAPSKHWWKTPRRQKIDSKLHVLPTMKHKAGLTLDIFDISSTGLFVYNKTGQIRDTINKINDNLVVSIPFMKSPILCHAKVVRQTDGQGIYPSGLGIQFDSMSFRDKLKLKLLLTKEQISSQF